MKKKVPLKSTKPTWDEYFLALTEAVGSRSSCDRGRTGCVITRDKRILATGYSGAPKGLPHCDDAGHEMHTVIHADGTQSEHCIRTTHAEQNAIAVAARFGISLDGGTLYCHMTPCYTCAKTIINAGIKNIVVLKDYHAGKRSKEIFKEAKIRMTIKTKEVEMYIGNQKSNKQ
ncbi:MAG: cytidine/deoxycytidylate deaminase family protein [Candidatus Paceibacterota bacterium]|jgi:dCMP deaminase|nr:cytidine/deoxycytidylate deaminase family protein [Candidatus Paceibacterota bacterium]